MSSRPVTVLLTALTALVAAATLVVAPAEARPATAPYDIKPFVTRAGDEDRLERAWAAWQQRDVDRYVTRVTLLCYCFETPDVLTRVLGDRVTSVTKVGRDRQLRRHGHEIEALYRLLRRAYREADAVDVRFRGGVPVRIWIDWDAAIADEEYGYRVRLTER